MEMEMEKGEKDITFILVSHIAHTFLIQFSMFSLYQTHLETFLLNYQLLLSVRSPIFPVQ